MVLPGILRKVNKTLPALLQTLVIICFIHFIAQNVLTKARKKFHQNHFSQVSSSAGRPKTGGHAPKFSGAFSRSIRSTSSSTTTTTTPPPPAPDQVMEEEQQRRLDILHKACTKWNLGLWSSDGGGNVTVEEAAVLHTVPKTPLYQALLVSEEYNLAVCPVARTGIQWLARRLLQLTGKFEEDRLRRLPEPPAAMARHNFPYLSSWEKYPVVLAKSVTVLMARHPFDRLLASYRYFLEDPEKNPQGYLHYGRRIVHTYRQAPVHHKGPTFQEFVRFLLAHDTRHLEEAWQSVLRKCTPCHIEYNTVIHYETLWHDVQWVWKRLGLRPLNTTDYVVNNLTPDIRRQYFSELTLAQVLELYKKYKFDFQLYGYTLDEHMAYAKPGEEALDPAVMADLPKSSPDRLQDVLEKARRQALLEKPQENIVKQSASHEEPFSFNGDPILTGDRGSVVEVSNDIEPAEDYRPIPLEQE